MATLLPSATNTGLHRTETAYCAVRPPMKWLVGIGAKIKEKSGGLIHVEANFSTAGGQKAAMDTVRTELCKLVEAAAE